MTVSLSVRSDPRVFVNGESVFKSGLQSNVSIYVFPSFSRNVSQRVIRGSVRAILPSFLFRLEL